jgi:hypothetical protein
MSKYGQYHTEIFGSNILTLPSKLGHLIAAIKLLQRNKMAKLTTK